MCSIVIRFCSALKFTIDARFGGAVKDQTQERWFQLCALATHEDDPTKLLALVTEVNRLLTEKEQLLTASQSAEMRRTWRDIAREVDREQSQEDAGAVR